MNMESPVHGVLLTYVGIIAPIPAEMGPGSKSGEDSEPPIFFHPMKIFAVSKILYSFLTPNHIYNVGISSEGRCYP